MARGFARWLLAEEADGPARLEDGAVHFIEGTEALLVTGREELGGGDELLGQPVRLHDALIDEGVRIALDDPLDALAVVDIFHDDVIDRKQRGSADQAAR